MKPSLRFITSTTPIPNQLDEDEALGPQSLDPIGYCPDEHKIYLLEHYDNESEAHPQLFMMHTRGGHAGRRLPVQSIYQGANWQMLFEERLLTLCRTLLPLELEPVTAFDLRTRVVKRSAARIGRGEQLVRKYALRLSVRSSDVQPAGGSVVVTAYLRPRARITQACRLPDRAQALVIASYVGIPFELGYEREAAILLHS